MNAFAMRRNAGYRYISRVSGIRAALPTLVLATAIAFAATDIAKAQTAAPSWPTDGASSTAGQGNPAWPTDRGSQPQSPASGSFGPPRGMSAPAGFSAPGAPPAGQEGQQACIQQFNELRGEVDKKGKIAKGISERKGTREELCSAMGGVFAAESKWVKFAKDRAATCGIPAEIIKQLGQGHDHLAQMRTRVCSSAGAAGPAKPPSLAEALGTTRQPDNENTTVRRGGTLDTLTGNPIK